MSIRRQKVLFVIPMFLFSAASFGSQVCAPLKLENWEPGCFLQFSHLPPQWEYFEKSTEEFFDFNTGADGQSSEAQERDQEYSLLREEWRSLKSKKTT